MLIKICGITRLEDAISAVMLGANALGFVFYPPSPRYVDPGAADKIIARLPNALQTFGVFVDDGKTDYNRGSWNAVQIHGIGDKQGISHIDKRVFIATSAEDYKKFDDFEIIIDESMGRGIKADWTRLRNIQRDYILSGGLTTDNVGEALSILNPSGVDISSGVEKEPGIKDFDKMKSFINTVKQNNQRRENER